MMPLKPILSSFEHAALPESLREHYSVQLDGNYKLDLGNFFVTDRDPSGLMSALESEREEHRKTKSHLDRLDKEAKEAKKQAELAEVQKSGDIEQLKQFFAQQQEEMKREFAKQVEAEKAKFEQQKQAVAEQHRQSKALEIATELFGKRAPLMLPHVLSQLKAVPGETPTVEILNSSGQPDLTATLDSFKKSFLQNPMFKDMIVVSKASGGSANEGTINVPATRKEDGSPRAFSDYTPGELVRLKKDSPDEFKQLLETHQRKSEQWQPSS